MDDKQKREAEVAAAALLLLSKRATHTIQLAMLGAARRGSSAPLLATRDDVEAAVGKAVEGARSRAQAAAGEAFGRQTGETSSLTRRALGTGRAAAGSLADQWAARVTGLSEVEGDTIGQGGWYGKAAQDLSWAAQRTAVTETFAEYNAESRAAYDGLVKRGIRAVRIWKAQLEACPVCRPLHDTEADASGQFPYGDPLLHVNCCCYVETRIE